MENPEAQSSVPGTVQRGGHPPTSSCISFSFCPKDLEIAGTWEGSEVGGCEGHPPGPEPSIGGADRPPPQGPPFPAGSHTSTAQAQGPTPLKVAPCGGRWLGFLCPPQECISMAPPCSLPHSPLPRCEPSTLALRPPHRKTQLTPPSSGHGTGELLLEGSGAGQEPEPHLPMGLSNPTSHAPPSVRADDGSQPTAQESQQVVTYLGPFVFLDPSSAGSGPPQPSPGGVPTHTSPCIHQPAKVVVLKKQPQDPERHPQLQL